MSPFSPVTLSYQPHQIPPPQATFFNIEFIYAMGFRLSFLMTRTVFLVDDNAIQAATRRAILARAGNDVTVASSAPNALHVLERGNFLATLGLLITDHLMPGMNGPEFIRRLRTFAPTLPVLVLSGLSEAEPEYEGLDVTFRLKPFPPEQLIALVRSLLGDPMSLSA